jgi:hypothetical protein
MESEEWGMIVKLMDALDDMTDEAATFVKELHEYLDPHSPFLDQQSEKQEAWLRSLYEKHENEDDEAAQDIYDESN